MSRVTCSDKMNLCSCCSVGLFYVYVMIYALFCLHNVLCFLQIEIFCCFVFFRYLLFCCYCFSGHTNVLSSYNFLCPCPRILWPCVHLKSYTLLLFLTCVMTNNAIWCFPSLSSLLPLFHYVTACPMCVLFIYFYTHLCYPLHL